jgi:hypothetical protein
MHDVTAAAAYVPADDLAIIASYFNPSRYRVKLRNLEAFSEPFSRGGVPLFIVEHTVEGTAFELSDRPGVTCIRGGDTLWQKERLLNIVIDALPDRFTKIAWVDADVLFSDPEWIVRVSALLDRYAVVQPFAEAVRLPPSTHAFEGVGQRHRSFAGVYERDPHLVLNDNFDRHGHSGFAWAARRDALPRDLYDACIAGSGDHMMAHAFVGDWDSACIGRTFGRGAMRKHFVAWAEETYAAVRANVGCVAGSVFHLWHGDIVNRRYVSRHTDLIKRRFDPFRDIVLDASGCWNWASHRPDLAQWAAAYFAGRREDAFATADQLATGRPGF